MNNQEKAIKLLLDFNLLRRAYLKKFVPLSSGLDSKINFSDSSLISFIKAKQFQNTTITAAEVGISQSFCSRSLAALAKKNLIKKSGREYTVTASGNALMLKIRKDNSNGYQQLLKKSVAQSLAKNMNAAFSDLAFTMDSILPELCKVVNKEYHGELIQNSIARKLYAFGSSIFKSDLTHLELQLLNIVANSSFNAFPLYKLDQILTYPNPAINSVINKLRKEKLIESYSLFFDKKNSFLSITPKGKSAYQQALKQGAKLLPKNQQNLHKKIGPAIDQMREVLPKKILDSEACIMLADNTNTTTYKCLLIPTYALWPNYQYDCSEDEYIEIKKNGKKVELKGNFSKVNVSEVQKILKGV